MSGEGEGSLVAKTIPTLRIYYSIQPEMHHRAARKPIVSYNHSLTGRTEASPSRAHTLDQQVGSLNPSRS